MAGQQDKSFVRTFVGVIAVLVVVTIVLIVLAGRAGITPGTQEEREALARERAEQRLQPVGAVRVGGEPMPEVFQAQAQAAGPRSAEQIVQGVCAACHGTGVLNAPKIGDGAAWKERMAQGLDTVVQHAIEGIRAMPPRGGDASLSDEEVRSAVVFMLEKSGISAQ